MNKKSHLTKRKFSSKFSSPYLQLKIGIYCILISLVFSLSLTLIIIANFSNLFDVVIELTDAQETVYEIVMTYWSDTQIWIFSALLIYITLTILVCIVYTHKLIGPTVAFKRHITLLSQGNYKAKIQVRDGDAFNDIAAALNGLTETLNSKHPNESPTS